MLILMLFKLFLEECYLTYNVVYII